jgi:DNA-binding NtrC family response regulator
MNSRVANPDSRSSSKTRVIRWLCSGGEWVKIIRGLTLHCVVDDEPRLRQVLTHIMRRDGFNCVEAANGVEALEQLRRYPFSLMLTDLRMPRLDGMDLLRHVRAHHPDVAVVMITGVPDVQAAVNCLSNGAMDYLTKPFHLEEVRARVSQAMDRRRLILENREYQRRLRERVEAQAGRLESLFLASIQSLADALEVKDPYTHGHSLPREQLPSRSRAPLA